MTRSGTVDTRDPSSHGPRTPTRLSESCLWDLQNTFFKTRGIEAWRQEIVPHYVTSNPFIAGCYAQQVLGVLRDLAARGLDSRQPIHILEIGAGSGRFAYHFLSHFIELLDRSSLSGLEFCYVLSDYSDRTLDFWQNHPQLQDLYERGYLDFGLFDAETDHTITLERRGQALEPGTLLNPPIVIANYLFDSLPHDAFRIRRGEIEECLLSLDVVDGAGVDEGPGDTPELSQLIPEYTYRPAALNPYHNHALDSLLEGYRRELDDTHILLPVGALRCIDNLNRLAEGPWILITADMGHIRADELVDLPAPTWNTHGSISLPVNVDAIARTVRNKGGEALLGPHHHTHLTVATFAFGLPQKDLQETRLAFVQAFDQPGPDAFFVLKKHLEQVSFSLSLEEILAHLRLSHWDAKVLQVCYPRLLDLTNQGLAPQDEETLYRVFGKVWDRYFAMADSFDLPFHIGTLLYQIGYFREAIEYFEHSSNIWGHQSQTLAQVGLCHFGLRQLGEARKAFEQALELEGEDRTARDMLARLARLESRDPA